MKISTKIDKKNTSSQLKAAGLFAVSAFVAASAVYLYSPTAKTNAETNAAKNVRIGLEIDPIISIRTNTDELTLSGLVGFSQGTVNVDVSTNSAYGYTLTIEDSDNNTSMANTVSSVHDAITSSFADSKTSSEMSDNTWGFSLNATDFYQIPVNGEAMSIKRTQIPMTEEWERTPVNFGAKVGMDLTAGTYEDSVVFTAYVNGQ